MDISNSNSKFEDIKNEIKREYANDRFYQEFIKECIEIFDGCIDDDKYSLL